MFPHGMPIAEDRGGSPGNGVTPTLLSREPLMMEEEFYGKPTEEIDAEFTPGNSIKRDESTDEPSELPFWSDSGDETVGFGKPPSMSKDTPLAMDFTLDPDLPDF